MDLRIARVSLYNCGHYFLLMSIKSLFMSLSDPPCSGIVGLNKFRDGCAATGHVAPSHHTLPTTRQESAWQRDDRRNAQAACLLLAFEMILDRVVGFQARRAIHADSLECRADANLMKSVLLAWFNVLYYIFDTSS
jgi:hypothetical protein